MMRRLLSLVTVCLALSAAPALQVSAAATAPLEGLPKYDHVFVLVEENESITNTYGSPSYLQTLSKQGAFADHYYAIGHVSLDNYIAMISGQPDQPLTGSDCLAVSLYLCAQGQTLLSGGRNLADQLDDKGVSWKGYMDGTTQPCVHGPYDSSPATFLTADPFQGNGNAANTAGAGPDYADRHNPFLFFPDIVSDAGRCQAHVRPFTELATDIGANTVPQFGFVTPDTCHDGHDAPCSGGAPGGLASANAWLQGNITTLINYLNTHNGLLLITTDESANTDESGCCSGGFGNGISGHSGSVMGFGGRVGLVALGPGVKNGQTITTSYDHASLLRTLEDFYGISEYLNNAAGATAMSDLFAAAAASPTSTPIATAAPTTGGAGKTLPNTNAEGISAPPSGPWLPASIAAALVAGFGLRKRLAKRGRTG